jgi:hypothetical protein
MAHGSTEGTLRPPDWGKREKHHLKDTWASTKRTREGRCQSWDDIWTFVSDVGERPSDRHRLRRKDQYLPWGPENFFWQESVQSESAKLDRNKYARNWRAKNAFHVKDQDMRRRYGIGLKEYDAILEAQGGGCAICKTKQGDDYYRLAVDHCHDTMKVRGILCSACNRAIGGFKENLGLIEEAARYLRRAQSSDSS